MAAAAATAPARSSRPAWRTAWITPRGELLAPPRMTATALRLAVQVFLVSCLWRGLYAHAGTTAGLDREQAVGYAVLAVLATRIRGLDRQAGRDTVLQHLHFGTIVYWFLRPVPPRRYYALRALGDQLYGFAWVLAGYLVCRVTGVLPGPASASAAAAFAAALLLGQLVLYYLMLLIDLLCFWTLRNGSALRILQFAQNLLSGAYAPLWFFPGWFITMSAFLPFQATLNTPLSLYIGRIPVADAPRELLVQALWAAGLAVLTRWLWQRAAHRVVSQGG
ncbi:ABC transporter permease [Peterkaempfera bronchialis]|uniref:ABC-2 type transport system permease protein n=1 Tax=Peterkaempfera bronchialis TaxID=2126346 RepID=A0A345SRG8_9ACTN|nr:ABC-2 family transporter protein [Peterkaempfera bronchialis]AXI76323.1 hypothetical protein C7M71_001330 [Peterkaempfera bronchialis]